MSKTKRKKESEGIDLIENPEAIVSKTEEFFDNKKNQNIVFGVGGVIAFLIIVFMGYKYYITNSNNEAQEEMFQAVYYFESDSLGKALNGDGNNYGFLDIIDVYSGTASANLSNFYVGNIYLRLKDFDNAIRYLNDFSGGDVLVQARAYALIGDAYMELDNFQMAEEYFGKAADYNPNKEFSPTYLAKKSLAFELQGKYGEAADAYNYIIENYYDSQMLQEAQKQKARLEGLAAE